jgi:RNA polymerase sigma-70 factor (ECF subfamily)
MSAANDGALVADVGAGEARAVANRAEAFGQLTDRQLDASFRLAALILGDRSEAEDAVHDALVSAWRNWASLRDPGRFDAWFGRIVTNVCRDRMRRRRLSPIVIADLTDRPAPDELDRIPERDALRRALRQLDVDHRIVIVLRYFEDLTVDEIADRLGERPGTVKSRLHYALRSLRAACDAAERISEEGHR